MLRGQPTAEAVEAQACETRDISQRARLEEVALVPLPARLYLRTNMAPRDLTRSLQRTLEHLNAPRRAGGQHASTMPTHFRSTPAFVQQKDRIAYWHIAPGDRVTVIKGGEQVKGRQGVVDYVERESNRVYLKESEFRVSTMVYSADGDTC